MKRSFAYVALCVVLGLIVILPVSAQTGGISVTCDGGGSFDNGVEVRVVQMRTGFNYTATAVGLNGFDPVLAVLGENGQGLCNDDDRNAAAYSANLPSTGQVSASNLSSQVTFANNSSQPFADISLVVGGFGNQSGEFILILEGMALTQADNQGDPFSVLISPNMVASGVNLNAYMISVTNQFDPLMTVIDSDYNPLADSSGAPIACDDAGNSNLCWGESVPLTGAFVSRTQGRQLAAGQFDAMLSIPLSAQLEDGFINFLMRSYQLQTFGDYIVVFHIGIGDSSGSGGGASAGGDGGAGIDAALGGAAGGSGDGQSGSSGDSAAGISVTCDGGGSFDNGVEVRVVQMRTGFNYTATAVGLNGFDPVLAVLGENGQGLCNDDDRNAAAYSANLPSTGQVSASNLSSQVTFANNSSQPFADISLVVGGFGNQSGEFILILEGMALTQADNQGDPFSVLISPNMVASGVNLNAYMISVTNQFDPLMTVIDSDYNPLADSSGAPIACDDAGNSNLCWGESVPLTGAFVSRTQGRQLAAGQFDAMLSIPLSAQLEDGFINFLMRSYQLQTFGDYIVVFHIGIGE